TGSNPTSSPLRRMEGKSKGAPMNKPWRRSNKFALPVFWRRHGFAKAMGTLLKEPLIVGTLHQPTFNRHVFHCSSHSFRAASVIVQPFMVLIVEKVKLMSI